MPMQKGKSGLVAKLGNRLKTAHEKHKSDETRMGRVDLPPGLNGIAQLVDCKFTQIRDDAQQGAGEYMFYAAGVVLTPAFSADGQSVKGLRTQISEPLYDTPTRTRKTVDEHVDWIYNELRKLGADTSKISYDELESVAESLKAAAPYFRFRTSAMPKQVIDGDGKGRWTVWNEEANGSRRIADEKKSWPTKDAAMKANPYAGRDPMIYHNWNGVCEYIPEEGEAPSMHDTASPNGEYSEPEAAPDEPDILDPDAGDGEASLGIIALGAAADEGDDEAIAQLTAAAEEAGITEDQINGAKSWGEVADMIAAATLGDGPGSDDAASGGEDDWAPQVGEIYQYKPIDPKTKKKVAKAIEVEVKAVDTDARTMRLQNMDNKKLFYKDVSWDDLES